MKGFMDALKNTDATFAGPLGSEIQSANSSGPGKR